MPNLSFTLEKEFIELHQLLKLLSIANSGAQAKQFIADGKVKVDGQVELRKRRKITSEQTILIDDIRISIQAY